MLTSQETRRIHDSMNRPKSILLLIFTFYHKYLKFWNYFSFRKQRSLYLISNCINGFVVSVKQKSRTVSVNMDCQEANKSLFCACNSDLARCHQCHFWLMNLMFKANCMGKWAWQLSFKYVQFMRLWMVAKFIKGLLQKCKYYMSYSPPRISIQLAYMNPLTCTLY